MLEFTLGGDPELFLVDSTGNAVPSIGLLGGTKHKPVPITGGAMQEDNVLAEINIGPARDKDTFVSNTLACIESLNKHVSQFGLQSNVCSLMQFKKEDLQTRQARYFGCSPDYNIYSHSENEMPTGLYNKDYRVASGNIHIGYERLLQHSVEEFYRFIYLLDICVGIPLALFMEDRHLATLRRQHYGFFGSYRPKPYGLEYRVPDNSWLQSKEAVGIMWDLIEFAIEIHEGSKDDFIVHLSQVIFPEISKNFSVPYKEKLLARQTIEEQRYVDIFNSVWKLNGSPLYQC